MLILTLVFGMRDGEIVLEIRNLLEWRTKSESKIPMRLDGRCIIIIDINIKNFIASDLMCHVLVVVPCEIQACQGFD